jgi:NAD(P)-dependent dehydrogenase (short-subunit alcohol dehydrogenase family)
MLDGKVALVTGAASGIGRATVARFRTEGAAVVAVDLAGPGLDGVAEADGAVPVAGSVDDPATYDAAVAAAAGLGGLDVVHLNAGRYGYTGPIEDMDVDLYRSTVGANVDGVVLGCRAVVPALKAQGGGDIVVTASVAGVVPFPPNPLYTLTKYAVSSFVVALAPTLATDGIRIDAVCPAIVDTPMTAAALGDVSPEELGIPIIPVGDIVDVVLGLATTDGTGRCSVVMPGMEPIPFAFPDWGDVLR